MPSRTSSSELRLKRVRLRPAPLNSSRSSTLVSLRTKRPRVAFPVPAWSRSCCSSAVRIEPLSSGASGADWIEWRMTSSRGCIHAVSCFSSLPEASISSKKTR